MLAISERPIAQLESSPPLNPENKILRFDLKLGGDASRKEWIYHLGNPSLAGKEVSASVAPAGDAAIPSSAKARLVTVPKRLLVVWSLLFAVILVFFFILAAKSDVLRSADAKIDEAVITALRATNSTLTIKPQYSLARVQAAWWFFTVLAAFLLIGVVTSDFTNALNATALGLLGIGSGTLAGSATIDAAQSNDRKDNIKINDDELTRQIGEHGTAEVKKLYGISKNFLFDIVSDAKGVAFHRFQVVAWTLIITAIFTYEVYRNLAIPDLNTLLGVQTLSVLTYLGLKIPEKKPSN